jgi:putative transposase
MIHPLVRELAATGAPIRVPVAVTCRVLKIARQPFVAGSPCPCTASEWDQALLANAIVDAGRDDPVFG